VSLTTQPDLVPKLKKEWSYTSSRTSVSVTYLLVLYGTSKKLRAD